MHCAEPAAAFLLDMNALPFRCDQAGCIGGERMYLERGDGRVTLYFEVSPNQQAMTAVYALVMAGVVIGLLYGCVHAILYAATARALQIVPFFLGCAALAGWNGASTFLNQDCTTVFDLRTRTATLTKSGLITRRCGPVSFDEIVGLGTRVGFADNHRSVIAELMLSSGEQWRLGYELIWLRPVSSSDIPGLIAQLRKATGLAGRNEE
jgi:hypothetical protein